MPLSEQTIAEMKAGMGAVAKAGGQEVDNAYMDAMIRTGIRAKWLRDQEKAGKIKIEKVMRRNTGGQRTPGDGFEFMVRVGTEQFWDPNACLLGYWPSEVLLAQVALALGAGVGELGVST